VKSVKSYEPEPVKIYFSFFPSFFNPLTIKHFSRRRLHKNRRLREKCGQTALAPSGGIPSRLAA